MRTLKKTIMKTVTTICITIFLVSLFAGCAQSLYVFSPPSLAGWYSSPRLFFGPKEFNWPPFNSTLIFIPDGGCKPVADDLKPRVIGKAAYVGVGYQGCSFAFASRNMQNLGASAVIFAATSGTASKDTSITDGKPEGDIIIPIISLDFAPNAKFIDTLKNGEVVVAQIENTPNPWYGPWATPVFVTYGAIIGILCFFNIVHALLKLWFYLSAKGFTISTLLLLLFFQIVANTLRLAFLWGDPHGAHRKWDWRSERMMTTISEPFQLIAECLTLLCWYDLLTIKNTKSAVFLNGKWPRIMFGVLGCVLLAIEFATAVPHATFKGGVDVSRTGTIIYAIVHLFCAITYFILGRKLMAVLSNSNNTRSFRAIVRTVYLSSLFLFLLIVGMIVMATPIFWEPWGFAIVWLWLWLCVSMSSAWQITSLTPPKWPGLIRFFFGKYMAPDSDASTMTSGGTASTTSVNSSTSGASKNSGDSSVSASASSAADV